MFRGEEQVDAEEAEEEKAEADNGEDCRAAAAPANCESPV
jgi:hypothetical protein